MRTQDVAGQIQGFYDRASKQCPEVGDRRRALAAICDAINRANLMKKWRGKPWVATLLKELE
jgi:hypothetical protein